MLVASAEVVRDRGDDLAAMELVTAREILAARPLLQVRGRPPAISRRLR